MKGDPIAGNVELGARLDAAAQASVQLQRDAKSASGEIMEFPISKEVAAGECSPNSPPGKRERGHAGKKRELDKRKSPLFHRQTSKLRSEAGSEQPNELVYAFPRRVYQAGEEEEGAS